MNHRYNITISNRGGYFTIFLKSDLEKNLARILFTLGSNEDYIIIDDLLTSKRGCGYGTTLVNQFIDYAKNNFSHSIRIKGYVRHDEIFNYSLGISMEEGLISRKRRNNFWRKFGFNIIEDKNYHDNILSELGELKTT